MSAKNRVLAAACGLILHWGIGAGASAQTATACSDPTLLAQQSVLALGTKNTLYALNPGAPTTQVLPVSGVEGNLLGINRRPSDGLLYGLTDTGNLYQISLGTVPLTARLVSTLAPRFAGGFQALANFNPTGGNALRVVGSNDQNFAVTNANGGNLNQTVVQSPLQYVAGDTYAGADPNITAGAYDNKVAGAAQTTFYLIDYDLDTLVTIADRNAGGSSNTAGGLLKTIGPLIDAAGTPIKFAPLAGMDIFTRANGSNVALAVTNNSLYCIDLATVNANLPIGSQQKVIAQLLPTQSAQLANLVPAGGLMGLAVVPVTVPAPSADVSVTASADPAQVMRGQQLNYSILVRNTGTTAEDVRLDSTAVPLASGVAVASQGYCTFDGRLSCQLGNIAGRRGLVTVELSGPARSLQQVPLQTEIIVTAFTAGSRTADPNPVNNSAKVIVGLDNVSPPPQEVAP